MANAAPAAPARTSALLARSGFRHAFFTRHGGVSKGPFESLNFIRNSGDEDACVEENLRRAASALGIEPAHLLFLSQVHGVAVHEVTTDDRLSATLERKGDIVLTMAAGVGCGVRTADCAPVLIGDVATGAVAAVHSGWRGTVQRAVVHAVRALAQRTESPISGFVAAIGPHLAVERFEVGQDVADELAACSTLGAEAVVRRDDWAKPHVDVRRILRAQLIEAGLSDGHIDDVPGCTVDEPETFFSYRRDGKVGGRLLSAIVAGVTPTSRT